MGKGTSFPAFIVTVTPSPAMPKKRPAAAVHSDQSTDESASPLSPKRKRKVWQRVEKKDPVLEKCDVVIAALRRGLHEHKEDMPSANVIDMFSLMIPESLAVVKEERHHTQTRTIGLVANVLERIQGTLEAVVARAQKKVDGAEEEGIARQATLARAEANLVECKKSQNEDMVQLTQVTAEFKRQRRLGLQSRKRRWPARGRSKRLY